MGAPAPQTQLPHARILPFGWAEARSLLKRHGLTMAAFVVSVTVSTAAIMVTQPHVFLTEATILLEPHTSQVLDDLETRGRPPLADESLHLRTQYQVLKSRRLAARVIQEVGLQTDFTIQPPTTLPSVTTPIPADTVPTSLVGQYLSGLVIEPVSGTRLVKVGYTSRNPLLAAQLANAHAQAYIRQGIAMRSETNAEALRFLEGQLTQLRQRVERSEVRLNDYRREKGLIELNNNDSVVLERVADLNKRLADAEADRITLEAQVRLIRAGHIDELPAVVNDSLIRGLKEALAKTEAERAQVAAQFKPTYPAVVELAARVQETERRLGREIRRVIDSILAAFDGAAAKEKQLRQMTEQQKGAALQQKSESVEYGILIRDVDTSRALYESVLQRMKELGLAAGMRASDVEIIDAAAVPTIPSGPQRQRTVLIALLTSLVLAIAAAVVSDHIDDRLRLPTQVVRAVHAPTLGVVPTVPPVTTPRGNILRFRRGRAEPQYPAPVVWTDPVSSVAEAYRTIRTSLLLSQHDTPFQSVLVTSGLHGEGKTTTAVNLAAVLAQMNTPVLLIDADLRRPRCERALDVLVTPGLSDVLAGTADFADAVQSTADPQLFVLSGGSVRPNPTELIDSPAMRALMRSVRERYAYVVIDSPPSLAVNEAIVLSTMVDGVVLVVRGDTTPREVARRVGEQLTYARARLLGVVLNASTYRDDEYPGYRAYYPAARPVNDAA